MFLGAFEFCNGHVQFKETLQSVVEREVERERDKEAERKVGDGSDKSLQKVVVRYET